MPSAVRAINQEARLSTETPRVTPVSAKADAVIAPADAFRRDRPLQAMLVALHPDLPPQRPADAFRLDSRPRPVLHPRRAAGAPASAPPPTARGAPKWGT